MEVGVGRRGTKIVDGMNADVGFPPLSIDLKERYSKNRGRIIDDVVK